jgi:hypothetical protein
MIDLIWEDPPETIRRNKIDYEYDHGDDIVESPDGMMFFMGTHLTSQAWFNLGVPLFVSHKRLSDRRSFPRAVSPWALDSGAFSELDKYHRWESFDESEYASSVEFYQREIGLLEWAAPMDWMCEPFMLEKTGLTIEDHQRLTVDNYLRLRERLGATIIPVLQGWQRDDYLRCWEKYSQAGVTLEDQHTVGLGSVCRRQGTSEADSIVRALLPLKLHGFGVKTLGLHKFGHLLTSADSMSWSFVARREQLQLPGCVTHINCANCHRWAMKWRNGLLRSLTEGES